MTRTFEQVADERQAVIDQADLLRTGELELSAKAIAGLGEYAYRLAQDEQTMPVQAEQLMVTLAASTKNPEITSLTHFVIDQVHPEPHIAKESHLIADLTIEKTDKENSVSWANQRALVEAAKQLYGVDPEEMLARTRGGIYGAEANARALNRQNNSTNTYEVDLESAKDQRVSRYNSDTLEKLEKDDAKPEALVTPKEELYEEIHDAKQRIENAPDDTSAQIIRDGLDDAAIELAALVLPKNAREDLFDHSTLKMIKGHELPSPKDALVIADVAETVNDDRLKSAVEEILRELPAAKREQCEQVLNLAHQKECSPLDVATEISPALIAA